MSPVVLADYQSAAAHAAIDAGADMILGHHPHILKGIEFRRGKPIFYSMGNFAIDQPQAFDPQITSSDSFKHLLSLHPGKSASGLYLLPEDTRLSVIVEFVLRGREVAETAILPVWVDDSSTPRILDADDDRFARVIDYLREVSAAAGFATVIEACGARALIRPA
jgi:poly-gamma-glutamate synthesis protein (capsule biosynthesis protein)